MAPGLSPGPGRACTGIRRRVDHAAAAVFWHPLMAALLTLIRESSTARLLPDRHVASLNGCVFAPPLATWFFPYFRPLRTLNMYSCAAASPSGWAVCVCGQLTHVRGGSAWGIRWVVNGQQVGPVDAGRPMPLCFAAWVYFTPGGNKRQSPAGKYFQKGEKKPENRSAAMSRPCN